MGRPERLVVEERGLAGYHPAEITRFGGRRGVTLRALLARLLPGVPEQIDLAAFVDRHTGVPLGRGDRPAGTPPEPELFETGLDSLSDRGFAEWTGVEQDALVGRMRRGDADEELGFPAKAFVDRVLDKALIGYLGHPDAWARIGFTGPAYPLGYAWFGNMGAVARRKRALGWDRL
jgi:hypothetical protein